MEDINSLSVAELKKRIKEKKTNLIKSNPLDKFTNIDELLKENQLALRDLIEEQHITNKILLALYIQEASDGSLVAKPIAGIDTSAILEGLRGGGEDDYQTLVKNLVNVKITGNGSVFALKGSGILAEIKFQSTNIAINRVYGVRIVSDKSIVYQDIFANFFNRSFHETDMSCWEDIPNACYLLVFQKIAFTKNLTVEIFGSTASFSDIYIKYHLKVVS